MITKEAKQKAELALLNHKGKYFKKIRLDKNFQKLVTFSPNKKLGIYNWFPYKEAFSKSLVHTLIDLFGIQKNDYILDPFCGIGTTLLAAREKGVNTYGVDIMPLCTFITEVKINISNYKPAKIKKYLDEILSSDIKIRKKDKIPNIQIISKAFPSINTFLEILALKKLIKRKVKNLLYQKLFILALLSLVERISNTKKDGAFLRMIERKNDKDLKSLFKEQIDKYLNDINDLDNNLFKNELCINQVENKVFCMDAREINFDKKFNAVITSPPYLNRYDYTRTYVLELAVNFVKNFDELRKIRYNTIRSHVEAKYKNTNFVKSQKLKNCLLKIKDKKLNNPKIPDMILGYFEDMYLVLERLKDVLQKKAKVAFVVGTVRYSGVNIPVDIILTDIGIQLGYKLENIIVTRIKGNSQQQREKYGEKATRESIVILSL